MIGQTDDMINQFKRIICQYSKQFNNIKR